MLNISNEKITITKQLNSLEAVLNKRSGKILKRLLLWTFGISLMAMFLPWTQNVQGKGKVTTVTPDQRPQSVNTVIGGKIAKWFVREGDFVKKGDTLVYITEIKDAYFDPKLLERTESQLSSKESSVNSYMSKIQALDGQIDALLRTGKLKLQQAENKLEQAKFKVNADSMNYEAAKTNFDIAADQNERAQKMFKEGLMSQTEKENRNLTMQRAEAQKNAARNTFLASKNEVLNSQVELISIQAEYQGSFNKAESDKFTAMSNMFDAEASITKMQGEYMNYSVRSGLYFITAPQDGIITNFTQSGIGEVVKEGQELLTIMPNDVDLAVEMYINPIDLPLIKIKHKVRMQFDGWPAVIFSGWPNASYGTYGGRVFAIDNFISPNGKYRILVQPDPNEPAWPEALRVGAGTHSILLLNDVPIWYELWRKLNGFPPDYYTGTSIKDVIPEKKK